MDPEIFLETAKYLLACAKNDNHEGHARSAVSRAYYHVYWLIGNEIFSKISLELLQTGSLCKSKILVHERLPVVLRSLPDPKAKSLGEHLNNLRVARVAADYKLKDVFSTKRAETECDNAIQLSGEIKAFGLNRIVELIEVEFSKLKP